MDSKEFCTELEHAINRSSMENRSNTPDFILANFLRMCLEAFDEAVNRRSHWYGVNDVPGQERAERRDAPETPLSDTQAQFIATDAGVSVEAVREALARAPEPDAVTEAIRILADGGASWTARGAHEIVKHILRTYSTRLLATAEKIADNDDGMTPETLTQSIVRVLTQAVNEEIGEPEARKS